MLLEGLDEFQRKAVSSPGNTLVVAGPGAGKTRVLLSRAQDLLSRGLSPARLFLLTFTVRTAGELRRRLAAAGVNGATVETFHAFAYRLARDLGRDPPALDEEDDYRALFDLAAGHPLEEQEIHLLIDEFQDLSPELIEFLSRFRRATFFLVGDPAQAIYGFRGARPEVALDFARSLPGLTVCPLLRSYRVPEVILRAALPLRDDFGLGVAELEAVVPGGEIGGLAYAGVEAEAKAVAGLIVEALGGLQMEESRGGLSPGQIAVVARVRRVLNPLKKALSARGVPVVSQEEKKKQCQEELGALCEKARGEKDRSSLLAHLQDLPSEIVPEVEEIIASSRDLDEVLFRLGLLRLQQEVLADQTAVNLMTIHEAKGLEFPLVILLGAEDGLLPLRFWPDTDEAEEKRLAYVALTRSAGRFVFTVAKKRHLFGQALSGKVSPYFSHLPLAEPRRKRQTRRQKSLF
ncbi:MAG: ATP-dependent helicase [Thermodesulfobacteria bacterium]|nr:ATP-dependent helicase [Thermodesulfobacteriota bacterium]